MTLTSRSRKRGTSTNDIGRVTKKQKTERSKPHAEDIQYLSTIDVPLFFPPIPSPPMFSPQSPCTCSQPWITHGMPNFQDTYLFYVPSDHPALCSLSLAVVPQSSRSRSILTSVTKTSQIDEIWEPRSSILLSEDRHEHQPISAMFAVPSSEDVFCY
ncbi:hypothetical protein WG66_000259 [Moniliophthora roreri]|uniref:Uncharacterized protein n=1 Tax=Moniliophthora roreri TaxID=221103 RepID=A0A0W0FVF5_MONRR|nr:hypothetical protein WG66_000259 [Moniliophthora roreri]